jgi:acetyl esterase
MPLNPQTEAFFNSLAQGDDSPKTHEQTPEDAREGYRALAAALGPGPDIETLDRAVPGSEAEIPVRIYTPEGEGPWPILVYYHGGGWVIGDLDTHDRECRLLATQTPCVVVSVDYRLAPEYPFPASHTDSWDATQWICNHAAELNGDASRIAVGGDSAGGNLAAFVALCARDADIDLSLQMLVYPATDGRAHHPESTHDPLPSLVENSDAIVLTRDTMAYFSSHVCRGLDPAAVTNDWRMSPLLAEDHTGLAPAYIATCEFDPIRDEGNLYADKLKSAGVTVQHKVWAGQPHLLFQLSPVLDDGKALIAECVAALKAAFK